MESKQYRVKIKFVDELTEKKWEIKKEIEKEITENDIVNTLCFKNLKDITAEDIREYRCKVLNDCDD